MSLTVRYYTTEPPDIAKWKLVNPKESRAQYKIYEEVMSSKDRAKIILGIVIKSLFTFGIYYFIYMRCSKDGKVDQENLKKRTYIHYVRNPLPMEDLKVMRLAKKLELIPRNELQKHLALIDRHRVEGIELQPIKDYVNVFKSCREKVLHFRKICVDIKELMAHKRAFFLDEIYGENSALTEALEKFFKMEEDQQNNYHFMRLISPFLKENQLSSLLKRAIDAAKKAQNDQKTIYHEAFEKFQIAYDQLVSKLDWFISIRKKPELFLLVRKLMDFGHHYSPQFKKLYDEEKNLFPECLSSMAGEFKIEAQDKIQVEESFKNWKTLSGDLNKNLASALSPQTYGIHYSLAQHLQAKIEEMGFDEKFQSAVSGNKIDIHFVHLFFSGKTTEVYFQMDRLIHEEKVLNGARQECQQKIDRAKEAEEEAIAKTGLQECQSAFYKIKKYFIDNPDHRDAVDILAEIELLLREEHPDDIDPRFFNFIDTLQQSDLFLKGKDAVCDQDFYHTFKPYFQTVDSFIHTFLDFWEKTAV